MNPYKELDLGIQEYVQHLQDNYNETARGGDTEFSYVLGRKYVHIIMTHGAISGFQRSSHSWVMMNDDKKFKMGDILKSASWNAPARNFGRGNVLTGDYKQIRWCGV